MSLTIYDASIPVFTRGLSSLSAILYKATAFTETSGADPTALINARLAPDMYTLAGQVQAASDAAKSCAGRLADVERPSFADTEQSFAELQERIAKTIAFIAQVDRAKIEAGVERPITMKTRNAAFDFTGSSYLLTFALPNFYFHIATAYGILRHNGLEIGKMDYLGGF